MTSEFGFRRDVLVTPSMLNSYFSMTKTEILVHLFLLSVCDEERHIKRNVRALARETKRWHADVYKAITGLKLKKMLEEKRLKTKGGNHWRVYPLPRTRQPNTNATQNKAAASEPESMANKGAGASTGILDEAPVSGAKETKDLVIVMSKPKRKGFLSWLRGRKDEK